MQEGIEQSLQLWADSGQNGHDNDDDQYQDEAKFDKTLARVVSESAH